MPQCSERFAVWFLGRRTEAVPSPTIRPSDSGMLDSFLLSSFTVHLQTVFDSMEPMFHHGGCFYVAPREPA